MRPAVTLRNVVGIGQYCFLVGIVPLHGDFYAGAILSFNGKMEDTVERRFIGVEIFNKSPQASIILEALMFPASLIGKVYGNARIEERQLPQAFRQNVIVKLNIGERL